VQFKDAQLPGIRAGTTTTTFRRWKSARVRAKAVYRIRPDLAIRVLRITPWRRRLGEADARAAGCASLAELSHRLGPDGPGRTLYRIDFVTADIAVGSAARDSAVPSEEAIEGSRARLEAMDRRSATGAWTARVLALIDANPGRRAGDLAAALGWDTPDFKTRVRRLKALGLTESLAVGYRLKLLGEACLRRG
jgi:hypothetical protein